MKTEKQKGKTKNRSRLLKALQQELGLPAVYGGAPGFWYQIGPYRLLKDGILLMTEPSKQEAKATAGAGELLQRLREQGLLEGMEDPEETKKKEISFLLGEQPHSVSEGQGLVNLMHMTAARGRLLGKSIGRPDAFEVKALLLTELNQKKPETAAAVQEIITASKQTASCQPGTILTGLRIDTEQVCFTGFPETPDRETRSIYRQLAERMLVHSFTRKWVKEQEEMPDNEKYAFRTWLNAIGMTGKEYKAARTLLLQPLAGNGAFRTGEQQEKALLKRRAEAVSRAAWQRGDRQEQMDFILL